MPLGISGYVSQDLFLPRKFDAEFGELLVDQKKGSEKPFPRKVDLWWATICIGVALRETRPISSDRVKFHTGQVFANEQWRVAHMELIALAKEGGEVLPKPIRVVQIADEFGAAGAEWIAERLRGSSRSSLVLLDKLAELKHSDKENLPPIDLS